MKNNTHFKSSLLIIALATGSVSTQVFALDNIDESNQNAYVSSFKAMDSDNNGSLSAIEVKNDKLFSKNFATADANNDGSLNQEEYSNYISQDEQKNVKEKNVKGVTSDSLITSKVKANLLKEEGLKSLAISVKTKQGVVMLTGFVETKAQIQQAAKIATETEGVTSVKNSLILKKD